MISTRFLKILLLISAALACILIATVILRFSVHTAAPFAPVIDKAEKITLQTGAATLTLSRDADRWNVSVSTAGPFKADLDKVKTLIGGLKDLQVDDMISEQGNRASDFEMNPESATIVSAYGKNSSLLAGGILGKQAEDFNHIYFRYPDKPSIYLAKGLIRGELGEVDLNSWRDRTLLNIGEDQVLTLVIDGPGFKTALARSSDTWSLNGQIVDPAPVWGLLGLLAHLKADNFVDPSAHPEWAADKLTYASATLQLKDGSTHTVHIGREDSASKHYPLAVDKDPDSFTIPGTTVKGILRKPGEFKPKKES